MAAIKERYQNPVVGDTAILRLFVYNSNNYANVESINNIKIYKLNDGASMNDLNARTLVQTIDGSAVLQNETGQYYIEVLLTDPAYTIGNYVDVWSLNLLSAYNENTEVTNIWTIYPDLWYTAPIPVVYDFAFQFRPTRFRQGSKRYIIIQVNPNVPKGTDLQRYYENLAIVGNLKVSIEQRTGNCLPAEQDLRIVANKVPVTFREKMFGYYMLDTTEMEIGIYDIWFELELGENIYISERNQLQIFD